MHLSLAAALLSCTAVQAFSNSSPFLLFSTAELSPASDPAQLQTSKQVLDAAKSLLASCPTERYLLVSQPNVHAADIRDADGHCRAPNLCRVVDAEKIRTSFSVAEVIGQINSDALSDYVKGVCASKGKAAGVEKVELSHLPSAKDSVKRAALLADNDHELGLLLDSLDADYTVLFFSDPNDAKPYEPEFLEPVHMDLKRDAGPIIIDSRANKTNATLPLFEKYTFFTPGVFMSLIAVIVLLSILGAGLSALSSLEVSYGAFDKEMGPAAQKKQI